MESLFVGFKRAASLLTPVAVAVFLAALPTATFAETLGVDDPVGRPFALWIFLVPVAGLMALAGAYAARAAVEKTGRR